MQRTIHVTMLALLVGVAIIYFTMPARAAESCRSWMAQMQEDEGRPVLVASACSDDSSQTLLSLSCFSGTLLLDYDLAAGAESQPDFDETAVVEFVTDGGIEAVPMRYQEMNGFFAGQLPASSKLVSVLQREKSLLVRDSAGDYPARTYSLKGSAQALATLLAQCR